MWDRQKHSRNETFSRTVMSISGLISTLESSQVNDSQSPKVGVLVTTFSIFFRLIRQHVTRRHSELC